MSRPYGKVTKTVRVPSNGGQYLGIESNWFAKYINRTPREVYDFYVEKLKKENEVLMLVTSTIERQIEIMKSKTIWNTKKKKKV